MHTTQLSAEKDSGTLLLPHQRADQQDGAKTCHAKTKSKPYLVSAQDSEYSEHMIETKHLNTWCMLQKRHLNMRISRLLKV